MGTLAEIEAAAKLLPIEEQKILLERLLTHLQQPCQTEEDPFAQIIGKFAGEPGYTGRDAEEILYGRGDST